MTDYRLDVLAIGNAIVDVLAFVDEQMLVRFGLEKGAMRLIDEQEADSLLEAMGSTAQGTLVRSGGSAANTAAGLASLGAKVGFLGTVRDDALGAAFARDIGTLGVEFPSKPATQGPATARSFIVVTPDGQRTMNTYLGACQAFGPDDVDADTVRSADTTYLEGYLWDPPAAKSAFRKASDLAHGAGRSVALTLSDSFCVARYRAELLHLLRTRAVDLVFANEAEAMSLYETHDINAALAALKQDSHEAVVTRGEKGAVHLGPGGDFAVESAPIRALVDTTGAGDLFAAGYLFGRVRGLLPAQCLSHGALAAAEVIQHLGARPEISLRENAIASGLPV